MPTTDRYQLLDVLGQGGMAVVYRAYDTRLRRELAFHIKVKIRIAQAVDPLMHFGMSFFICTRADSMHDANCHMPKLHAL